MSDLKELLDREASLVDAAPDALEAVLRRRDHKRRNQRIAAGVVGLAVFVAAVWIVTSVSSLDRSETSVGPAGDVTGPAETGPTETGPALTGPTVNPYSVGFDGLPPAGATPSEPLAGELVMRDVSGPGNHPYYAVNVYADGRLIWTRDAFETGEFTPTTPPEGGPVVPDWIEQRLTPEGVRLLRSGAVELGGQFENPGEQLRVSAWEDSRLRPYVASRYAACVIGFAPPSRAMELFPAEAQDLLRGKEQVNGFPSRCLEVTSEDARLLAKILSDAGFEQPDAEGDYPGGLVMFTDPNGNREPNFGVSNFEGLPGVEFAPLLPDGTTQVAAV
jgi:hypothetical protein